MTTTNVVLFTGHKRLRCTNPYCYGCNVCNLFICETCGGAEGSLPTHCPQQKMPSYVGESVYEGKIDFVDGKWVEQDALKDWR